jgi:hypothetical protein
MTCQVIFSAGLFDKVENGIANCRGSCSINFEKTTMRFFTDRHGNSKLKVNGHLVAGGHHFDG